MPELSRYQRMKLMPIAATEGAHVRGGIVNNVLLEEIPAKAQNKQIVVVK